MIPAAVAVQRPVEGRLLVVERSGEVSDRVPSDFADLVEPGDLVVANDAATLPASLSGIHVATGEPIELRLARWEGPVEGRFPPDVRRFAAVAFGGGNFRTPTEHRPLPPALVPGDLVQIASLRGQIIKLLGHPRLVEIAFQGSRTRIWEALARHGRPIQYAYLQRPLAIWDTWTRIASLPIAFEPPSAGFLLDWRIVASLRARGVAFATITHAAGISSTGDPQLDALLPMDEPYRIPASTVERVDSTRRCNGRIIAVGTTVVRALEDSVNRHGELRAGAGVATLRVGPQTRLRIVDALVTGVHEPGTSHYELLRAFQNDAVLRRALEHAELHDYRTHEFGDWIFLERAGIDFISCSSNS